MDYEIPEYEVSLVREPTTVVVGDADDAEGVLRQLCCRDASRERMVVLYLDGRSNLVGAEVVALGGRHGCVVKAPEVFRGAIVAGAAAIILGHNHPSGDPTPSPEDLRMTQTIKAAGELLGCPLLDHIVVTAHNGCHSMYEASEL